MRFDSTPWEEMTPKGRAAHVRMLREEAKTLPYDPDDDSLEILQTALTPVTDMPH